MRLLSFDLQGCVAKRKSLVSNKNKKERLKYARNHLKWSGQDWRRVLWSDESTFELFPTKGRVWIRPHVDERFKEDCLAPTVKHGGGSVTVWGCFSASGVGDLVRADGMMNSQKYGSACAYQQYGAFS
jgi:hypothetical protein